ncbi:hypothetical protein B0H63DRAFT_106274 [Podospora didyma]|uniref:Ankyrin repeat protein n=1 Tax=Podospora didyma TaxID=330526 RepID=A0AAE0U3U6_9PEZI|nr:hypothetical protein B0H63DRAFT_106274 [Podospora didyma]
MEMDISPAAPPPSSSPQARAGLDETPETAPVPAPTTSKTAVDGKSAATADARPIVIAEKSVDDRGGRGGKKPGLSSLKIGALGKGRKTSPAPPTPIGSRAPSLTRDGSLLSPQDRDTRGRGLAKSKAPATGSGAPGYDLKKYSAVSFNPQPSVDIIAVYDFEETAEDAWRDDSSSGQPRGGRQRDGSERDRESSRGSQRRRRREPSPLAAGEDGLPVALKATSQPGPSADGKAKIPSESKPNDSKSKNPRKDGKERPKIREGSIRSNPRSSIEVPDRRDNNQKRPESVHWLKDILCQDINRSRILTFSYPVVEKKPRYSLTEYVENAAKELLRKVKSARKGFIRGGVPIVFVGYGFGGIIIQKAMQLAVEEVKRWKKLHGGNDGAPAETTDDKIAGERNPGAKAQVSKDETAAAPFPVNDVCRLLFLDTPFPDMGSEGDPKWFPPNLNVRMCQILQQIKSQEKGSWVNSIWNDFATTTAERGARYSMYFRPVSWLYSKPKGAETDREGMDTLNIREFMASATYDLTFSVASTTKHRRLGRIPNAQDYVYRDILTIIRSSLLFHAIETQQVELVTALSKALKSQPEIVDGLLRTPLHIAAQLNPPSEKIVEILASDRPDDPTAQDCDGNQPLHYAVQRAFRDNPPPDGPERAEYENVIRCLLRNMPPNNKGVKNISGKNPWSICLVCESECEFECEFYDYLPGADYEWIWSLRDNPEPISGPVVDPGDTEPKRPKAPHKELPQYKDIFKTGIVAEFFHAKDASGRTVEHITWKTTSINEMIYDHDKGCAKVLEVGRAKHYANAATAIQEKDFRCRWLHIPANNVRWPQYEISSENGSTDNERK